MALYGIRWGVGANRDAPFARNRGLLSEAMRRRGRLLATTQQANVSSVPSDPGHKVER